MVNHPNRKHRRVWQEGSSVFLRDENIMGDEVIREFWVTPPNARTGYVWEHCPGADFDRRQVCEHLERLGSTLSSSADGLLGLIRQEYRRQQAARRREMGRSPW